MTKADLYKIFKALFIVYGANSIKLFKKLLKAIK